MNPKSDGTNRTESNYLNKANPSAVSSQPWWFGMGHGATSMDVLGESRKNSSPRAHPNGGLGSQSNEAQGKHGGGKRILSNKEMHSSELSQAGNLYAFFYKVQAYALILNVMTNLRCHVLCMILMCESHTGFACYSFC